MNKLFTTTALLATIAFSTFAYAEGDWHGKGGMPSFFEDAIAKFSKEDAVKFRDALKEAHDKTSDNKEKAHALYDEMNAIITADSFDKAAYMAKSEEIEKLHSQMHAGMTDALANAIGTLSLDDRKILAETMKEAHQHHWSKEKAEKESKTDNDQ